MCVFIQVSLGQGVLGKPTRKRMFNCWVSSGIWWLFHFILIKKCLQFCAPKKKKVNFFSSRRSWFRKFCYPFQSPLLGCSDSRMFRVHGEVGVLSGKPDLCVHFIPESRCPDLYAPSSSAHTSTSEVAWNNSYPSPILGGIVGRRAAGLLQRTAVVFHCFVTEISWEDSLFISLDPESPDRRQGGPTQAEGF